MGPRDKAALPTSQQMNKFPPKRMKYLAIPSFFVFLPHPQESSPLSAYQRPGSSNRANIPRTCWAKRFRPRIYLRHCSTNTPNYIREAKVLPIKNQLYSPNTPNFVREQMFAQLRTGFRCTQNGWAVLFFPFFFLSSLSKSNGHDDDG